MIAYVEKISEIDIDDQGNVSLVSSAVERDDVVARFDSQGIVEQAPQRVGRAFKVPQVVE